MSELFFAADHHFFHPNVIKFTDANGVKYRDFPDLDTMHNHIITKHNSVVTNNDTVYFLGDFTFKHEGLELLREMNGKKFILVMGNHDQFKTAEYLKYFNELHGGLKKNNAFLSHVPIHPNQLQPVGRWDYNIHGHTHHDRIKHVSGALDTRYFNVSMEAIDFTPINYDTINRTIKEM